MKTIILTLIRNMCQATKNTPKAEIDHTMELAVRKAARLDELCRERFMEPIKSIDAEEFVSGLGQTKIVEGSDFHIVRLGHLRMAEGCINRMYVTDDKNEYLALYKALLRYIKDSHDYALHNAGYVTLGTRTVKDTIRFMLDQMETAN